MLNVQVLNERPFVASNQIRKTNLFSHEANVLRSAKDSTNVKPINNLIEWKKENNKV